MGIGRLIMSIIFTLAMIGVFFQSITNGDNWMVTVALGALTLIGLSAVVNEIDRIR